MTELYMCDNRFCGHHLEVAEVPRVEVARAGGGVLPGVYAEATIRCECGFTMRKMARR